MSLHGRPAFQAKLLMPQFWATWLGVMVFWIMAQLPWRAQFVIGRWLGEVLWRLAKRRRLDTLINLSLCFPELSETQRIDMGMNVFRNGAIGFLESLSAWYNPNRLEGKVTIDGLHHLIEAQKRGQGVLLMGGHFSTLDLSAYFSSLYFSTHVIYRPQNNPLFEWLITRARSKMFAQQIDHKDMRTLVASLKSGHIVWYPPDQDFGLKQGVMAPFFGVSAATVTAPRRLVKMNNSAVLMFHCYRENDKAPHYQVTITPEILDYPSDDPVLDATRINATLEDLIRIAPTQWMWFHRRFKSQPNGTPSYYARPKKTA